MSKLPGDAIKFYVVNGEAGVDNVPGTADAEARSAINAILVILENLGLNASS